MRKSLLSLIPLLVLMIAPARADVTIYAAASLSDVLNEILADTDMSVHTSYAGTATLARQIEAGAPADIFITANSDWMDHLEERNLTQIGSRRALAGNTLVAIAPRDDGPPRSLAQRIAAPQTKRIALAETSSVPAGIYAKQALMSLELWSEVEDRTILIGQSVRDVLFWVERNEADLGFVYATDANRSDRVMIVDAFAACDHDQISYPSAILAGRDRPEVRRLYDHLFSPQAKATLQQFGFVVE